MVEDEKASGIAVVGQLSMALSSCAEESIGISHVLDDGAALSFVSE